MQLPTAQCPTCMGTVLVYRATEPGTDPLSADLQSRCVDCNTLLDRFGAAVELTEARISELVAAGYRDLDRGKPVGPGGCFENDGCNGCPKIDTRPW